MLSRDNALLLVIDIQERLYPAMDERDALSQNTFNLVEGIKAMGIPIIVTEQYTKGLGKTIPEVADSLSGYTPIEKLTFSCYGNEEFRNKLIQSRRRQIIISGIETHICVCQTALDLLNDGYDCYIVSDAVSSRTLHNKGIGIARMHDAGAWIVNTEMVLFELLKVAGSDEFRIISKLVK